MSEMWLGLLPVLLALMISPARTLAVVVLLHTPRSWRTALAYVMGMVSVMMLQGVLFGVGMSLIGLASDDRVDDVSVIVGVLYVIGGIILLVAVFKILTADPTGDGGKLGTVMEKLETVEPSGAFNVGAGWLLASPKQWVFVNTAVAVIFVAQLRPTAAIGTFLIFTLLVQLAYMLIILAFVVAQDTVTPALDSVFGWIRGRLRPLAVTLFGTLGTVFLIAGINTLS